MTVDPKNWPNFKNNAPYSIPEGFMKVDSLEAFSKKKYTRKLKHKKDDE